MSPRSCRWWFAAVWWRRCDSVDSDGQREIHRSGKPSISQGSAFGTLSVDREMSTPIVHGYFSRRELYDLMCYRRASEIGVPGRRINLVPDCWTHYNDDTSVNRTAALCPVRITARVIQEQMYQKAMSKILISLPTFCVTFVLISRHNHRFSA